MKGTTTALPFPKRLGRLHKHLEQPLRARPSKLSRRNWTIMLQECTPILPLWTVNNKRIAVESSQMVGATSGRT